MQVDESSDCRADAVRLSSLPDAVDELSRHRYAVLGVVRTARPLEPDAGTSGDVTRHQTAGAVVRPDVTAAIEQAPGATMARYDVCDTGS